MAAAFMVSYTRAKSESLGFTPGTGMAAVGIAPREVRLVILTIGLSSAASSAASCPIDRACSTCVDACGRRPAASSPSPSASSPSSRPSPTIQRIVHVTPSSQPAVDPTSRAGAAHVSKNGNNGKNGATPRTRAGAGAAGRQDPRRDRRRRQLREQPRPGPLLLRERQGRRLRPGPDARRPRRLPRPRHRVRRRLRHRQEQGRQGPVRGDLHEAEQHVRLPAGAQPASRSSAA